MAILLVRGTHVSQLARDLKIGRPVLHVHLAWLQEAGLVTSSLRFSDAGKPSAISGCHLSAFGLLLRPSLNLFSHQQCQAGGLRFAASQRPAPQANATVRGSA